MTRKGHGAQLWMLREGGKRDLIVLDDDSPRELPGRLPPFYWAAFVFSGGW